MSAELRRAPRPLARQFFPCASRKPLCPCTLRSDSARFLAFPFAHLSDAGRWKREGGRAKRLDTKPTKTKILIPLPPPPPTSTQLIRSLSLCTLIYVYQTSLERRMECGQRAFGPTTNHQPRRTWTLDSWYDPDGLTETFTPNVLSSRLDYCGAALFIGHHVACTPNVLNYPSRVEDLETNNALPFALVRPVTVKAVNALGNPDRSKRRKPPSGAAAKAHPLRLRR